MFFVCIVELLVENASISDTRVEFNPVRCKHEVNETAIFVAPKLDHSSKLELRDHFMRLNYCVHIGFQAKFCVN